MTISNRQFIIIYFITTALFSAYFYMTTVDCSAYYIHDDAIEISRQKMIEIASFLFIPTGLLVFIAQTLGIQNNRKLIYTHYFISLTAILLVTLAINKPCENINGGHYMFVSFLLVGLSYLLRQISYILTILILIIVTINFVRVKLKDRQTHK